MPQETSLKLITVDHITLRCTAYVGGIQSFGSFKKKQQTHKYFSFTHEGYKDIKRWIITFQYSVSTEGVFKVQGKQALWKKSAQI